MSNPAHNPPSEIVPQVNWLIAWVTILNRKVNALTNGSGGGGTVLLPQNEVAFGSSTNTVSSSPDFTYNTIDGVFDVTFPNGATLSVDDGGNSVRLANGEGGGFTSRGIGAGMGDVLGLGNGTSIGVIDSSQSIQYTTGNGPDNIIVDLSSLAGEWVRTEPNKDGQYMVAAAFSTGVTDGISTNSVVVTDANALPTSIITITPIGTSINVDSFVVERGTGSFTIRGVSGNTGLTFMYILINP